MNKEQEEVAKLNSSVLKNMRETREIQEVLEEAQEEVNKEIDSLVDEIGDLTLEETSNIKQ